MSTQRFERMMSNDEAIRQALRDEESPKSADTRPTGHHNGDLSQEDQERYRRVTEIVYGTDPYEKRLTGRTPERIEEETGIPTERMFPKDARILYVGDPWQRMGKVLDSGDVVIIDYAFGDSVEFIFDKEGFTRTIVGDYSVPKRLLESLRSAMDDKHVSHDDREWLQRFFPLVESAYHQSQRAIEEDTHESYRQAARVWKTAREFLEASYRIEIEQGEQREAARALDPGDPALLNEPLGFLRTQAWYDCVHSERGFKDIPDWEEGILPKLTQRASDLVSSGASEQEIKREIDRLRKTLIDEIRLKKQTDKSHVMQGVFPQLPFQAGSFDRFVASWSISTHAFPAMERKDFDVVVNEIGRVLKRGGEAFIFPLDWSGGPDFRALEWALEGAADRQEIEWKWYDAQGQEEKNPSYAYTLWIRRL